MTGHLAFLLLCIFCSCSCKSVNKDDTWQFLHLAQFWPPTSCYVYFGKESCSGIPKSVTGWTIHGLWPSNPGSEGPHNCDKNLPFDYNQIKSLSTELKSNWFDFNTSEDPTHLWKHEWEKHGTCAMSLPNLKGELNYFSSTLKLHKPLDLFGVLKNQKIVPSSKVMYKLTAIDQAIRNETDGLGVKPNIVCSYDSKTKHHFIEQVWICFTKNFTLMDCPNVSHNSFRGYSNVEMTKGHSRFHECSTQSVYYLPFTPPSQKHTEREVLSDFSLEREIVEHNIQGKNKLQGKQVKHSESIYFRSEVEEILRWH